MNFTEKYRPKTVEEFIGDKGILETLEEYVVNTIPTILVGPAGIGKNSAAYLISNKLGYTIVETNASDSRLKEHLKDLKSRLQMKTFTKTIHIIDEVDGVENQKDALNQDFLASIIKNSIHPVILTANEKHKISPKLQKVCKVIEMNHPKLYDIIQRMKQIAKAEGLDVTYERVSGDIRASINATFYNGKKYKREVNSFEKVVNVFRNGKVEDIDLIWLIDNVHNFYRGKDLYDAIQILVLVANTGNEQLLSCLPRAISGRPSYPYFLKKLKVMSK